MSKASTNSKRTNERHRARPKPENRNPKPKPKTPESKHIKRGRTAKTHQAETRDATSRKRGGGVLGGKADKEGVCAAHRPQRDPSVHVTRDAKDSATQSADRDKGQWHKRSERQRSGRERVTQAQRDPKVRERIT